MSSVLGAQSPPQPNSANFGVEVKGSQIAKGSNENEVKDNEAAPLPKVLGAQSPPQLDSANFGVKIGGRQIAKDGSNVNVVQNNKGAPLQMGNHGVSIGGPQVAGKDNKNKVIGNGFGATLQPKHFATQTLFEDPTQALYNPNQGPTQANPILVAPTHNSLEVYESSEEITIPPGSAPSIEDVVIRREPMKEGASVVPSKHHSAFVKLVELAEESEEKEWNGKDPNFVTFKYIDQSQPKKQLANYLKPQVRQA